MVRRSCLCSTSVVYNTGQDDGVSWREVTAVPVAVGRWLVLVRAFDSTRCGRFCCVSAHEENEPRASRRARTLCHLAPRTHLTRREHHGGASASPRVGGIALCSCSVRHARVRARAQPRGPQSVAAGCTANTAGPLQKPARRRRRCRGKQWLISPSAARSRSGAWARPRLWARTSSFLCGCHHGEHASDG